MKGHGTGARLAPLISRRTSSDDLSGVMLERSLAGCLHCVVAEAGIRKGINDCFLKFYLNLSTQAPGGQG